MKLRLTKQFEFEMAHALPHYDGKCCNIHGHSYKLEVTVEYGKDIAANDATETPDDGLVLDFHKLKQIVEENIVKPFDHSLVLPKDSPYTVNGPTKMIILPFQPTTENLLLHFHKLIHNRFPEQVRLYSIRLAETASSYAELII